MLTPKGSHLVERAAERLLRAAGPAAHLPQPPAERPATEAADPDAALVALRLEAAPAQRSSLFARRPSSAEPVPPVSRVQPLPADAPPAHADVARTEPASPPDADWPVAGDDPVASPAVPGPPTTPGQAGVSWRAAVSEPPAGRSLSHPDGPPSGHPSGAPSGQPMPQSPASIDTMALERAGMLDWSRTRTRISEEFRLVQRQIIRSAFGPGSQPGFSNLLLVTSARPGEGKSFMATNLSGSIARQGDHHVLLVDADSKRDSICYSLGLAQSVGLLDLVANPHLDAASLIVRTPIDRLSILPVGRERERGSELFSTKEMTRLIQSLGRRYADRLLILDAPPCLSTSDPAVLAQVVGQILFVVEADRTQRDEIEASLDLIQACPSITMVLNKQQMSSRYTFGAYSSYYSS